MEGYKQLSRYAKQLANCYTDNDIKILIFITRFPEIKEESDVLKDIDKDKVFFKQIRWYEVHKDLLPRLTNERPLLKEFLKFMEDKKMTLKLELFDLVAMVNVRKNEGVYWDILNEAWKGSKLSRSLEKIENKTGKADSIYNADTLAKFTPIVNEFTMRVSYGFWFNHETTPKTLESYSKQLPILFVSLCSDDLKRREEFLKHLQQNEKCKELEKESHWKFTENKGTKTDWMIFSKSIDLCDINRRDNLAEYFVEKLRDELNNLTEAFISLVSSPQ
jgi:hypothetical protein